MATLQQIRERVSRKLQDENNTSRSAAVVDSEINRSIRFYRNERFWFNEAETSISITNGTQTVPSIPSDLLSPLQINGFTLVDNQTKIDLEKLSPDIFREMDLEQTGRPEYFTYINGDYLLLPIADSNYTIKLRYLKIYDDLVNDADTNDFTENAEDLIMLHTLKNMYAEDKQDPQLAATYADLERAELRQLRERTYNINSTGYLVSSSLLI